MGPFKDLISGARREKNITLRRLSQLVNLSPSFISEIEHGKRLPPKDPDQIENLAIVLNIDKDELLDAAKKERLKLKKNPRFIEKLWAADHETTWALYRRTESASEDKLRMALKNFLKELEEEEG